MINELGLFSFWVDHVTTYVACGLGAPDTSIWAKTQQSTVTRLAMSYLLCQRERKVVKKCVRERNGELERGLVGHCE